MINLESYNLNQYYLNVRTYLLIALIMNAEDVLY